MKLQTRIIAPEPIPLPLKKPATLTSGTDSPHIFHLPVNTAGQTKKVRRRLLPEPKPSTSLSHQDLVPILPKPEITLPSTSSGFTQPPFPAPSIQIPYSTKQYRKRKLEKQDAGVFVRGYTKMAEFKACGQCGKDSKSGDHKQYFGNVFCPEKCSTTYEEWRAKLAELKGYGKKKSKKK